MRPQPPGEREAVHPVTGDGDIVQPVHRAELGGRGEVMEEVSLVTAHPAQQGL
jgi:hypothetical protein